MIVPAFVDHRLRRLSRLSATTATNVTAVSWLALLPVAAVPRVLDWAAIIAAVGSAVSCLCAAAQQLEVPT